MRSRTERRLAGARRFVLGVVCVGAAGFAGCATNSPAYQNQTAFRDAESAVEALADAAERSDAAALEALFGPDAREMLSSGDPVADRNQREVFVLAMRQGWSLERKDSNTRELIVGHERWPFPIPLEKDRHGWWFDSVAGKQEVLARRVGRNELAAIGVLRTYAIAQREYAAKGHNGARPGTYAQKIRSDPGTRNGLYWPVQSADDEASPLGQFAAQAAAEGYGSAQPPKDLVPYHGYYYRILTRQGAEAPGGARNYILNGAMSGGFAMVAYPAQYGNSGIMTFLINQDGIVFESDLGEATPTAAAAISEYNPGSGWLPVE